MFIDCTIKYFKFGEIKKGVVKRRIRDVVIANRKRLLITCKRSINSKKIKGKWSRILIFKNWLNLCISVKKDQKMQDNLQISESTSKTPCN